MSHGDSAINATQHAFEPHRHHFVWLCLWVGPGSGAANGRVTATPQHPLCAAAGYDYGEILGLSLLFYEAQRSGPLPSTNRIPWRGDSALGDVTPGGTPLAGGWYDAGGGRYIAVGARPCSSPPPVMRLWGRWVCGTQPSPVSQQDARLMSLVNRRAAWQAATIICARHAASCLNLRLQHLQHAVAIVRLVAAQRPARV